MNINFKWYVMLAAVLVMSQAEAGELEDHLKGKTVVYQGVCWMDKNNVLTFKHEEMRAVLPCVVGMELPDQSRHFVLLYRNEQPDKLVMYDEKTKTQTTLWLDNSI